MMNGNESHLSITVNGRFLSQSITGVQRYAFEVLRSIDQLLGSDQIEAVPVTVLVPPDARSLPEWQALRFQKIGRFKGRLWEQIDLAVHARGTLLFTPCGGAPVAHDRHVITIHDAGPFVTPEAYSVTYRAYYKWLQRSLSRKALKVITVSRFSKNQLMQVLGLNDSQISYTWLSGEHILRAEKDDSVIGRNDLVSGKYVLAVGSRNPNKNLDGLIAAMTLLLDTEIVLAIAGRANSRVFGRRGVAGRNIKDLGFVNDSELRSLYENAACFVFPSFYEGFGFPPLEALTLGTPVLVSRAASLPEILGEAAIYCNPYFPEDIAYQIRQVLKTKTRAPQSSITHASQFTWKQCAKQTWALLTKAADISCTREGQESPFQQSSEN